MTDAVIVEACRTAIGTARRGILAETSPFDLAHAVVAESVSRTGLDPTVIDDVVLAESQYGGGAIARHAALTAGLVSAPGVAVNRHCAAGLTAVTMAAGSIRAGMDEIVIAGGTESSSTKPVLRRRLSATDEWEDPWASPTHVDTPSAPNRDMSVTVGWNTARLAGLGREEMDAWALRSHQRAVAAIDRGAFAAEIVPIKVTREGETRVFETDEHPRRDTTAERLASLEPIHPEISGFSITAGNASGVNDAAAAVTLASEAAAARHGLPVLARVRSWASVGVDPAETGLAPTIVIPTALRRAGITLADIDLFEINEAFAAVPLAVTRSLDIDPELVNVNGSGCSLGHPIAATGARMVVTLVHELGRRGGGLGVVSMCAGGGMGAAAVIEVFARP